VNREPGQRLVVTLRPRTRALLLQLSEEYGLSQSAIVNTAILEMHRRAELGRRKEEKRGNGHP